MDKLDKIPWTNIRALKINVKKWTAFLNKHDLGSLPSYIVNAVNEKIIRDKKRLE